MRFHDGGQQHGEQQAKRGSKTAIFSLVALRRRNGHFGKACITVRSCIIRYAIAAFIAFSGLCAPLVTAAGGAEELPVSFSYFAFGSQLQSF